MSDKRWVVREGTVRGEGSYLELGGSGAFTDDGWHPDQAAATRLTRKEALQDAAVIDGTARVVRLVSRKEAVERAVAEATRVALAAIDNVDNERLQKAGVRPGHERYVRNVMHHAICDAMEAANG